MAGLGVASFGYINGVHIQDFDAWEAYSDAVRRSEIPLSRAYRPSDEERMIRELVLQLKLGAIQPAYFRSKYHVNILERFRDQLDSLNSAGYLAAATEEVVALTREALLKVDVLLRSFFLPQHTGIRYT